MVTFTCPTCGQERTGERRRCYPCTVRQTPDSRERIRQSLLGRKHPPERVAANSAARKRQIASGHKPFDIAGFMHGRPPGNVVPVGHRRVGNGHYQIKCADGKWRYEHRLVWEAANGPIPDGIDIHHINHDPLDNRLDNLEAVTRSEHMQRHANAERTRAMQLATVAKRNARKAAGGRY